MDELVGQNLGQYQVTELIGKGGMATVYRARQISMGRDVAMKVLPRVLLHDGSFLERFYREVKVIAQLQHPHIVPVYDYGEQDGMPYIVMAYLSGGTLADRIAVHGPMDLDEVKHIVRQVADALDYAHRKGIIHRDFKPSNVLLDEQGNCYLSDFGLAQVTETTHKLTGTGMLGTPQYMAPEQAEVLQLTPAADVYALGVTVFQMLTGRPPYEAPTVVGVLLAHRTHPIPDVRSIRPNLPEVTQQIISQAMAKSAEARYPTPGNLAAALESLAGEAHAAPALSQTGLMMTNMLGQVIFIDHDGLRMLKRHHHEARSIIGKPLHDVLGILPGLTERLIKDVSKQGHVENMQFAITDAQGATLPVSCTAMATYDNRNSFVGMDVNLQTLGAPSGGRPASFDTVDKVLDTKDETYLQTYFTAQIESLHSLLNELGGRRLGENLDKIVNETSQRNVWPVNMQGGKITFNLRSSDADIYGALLAKATAYAAGVVGERFVTKQIQTVDDQMDPRVLDLVKGLRLR